MSDRLCASLALRDRASSQSAHILPLVEGSGNSRTDVDALDWAMAFNTSPGNKPIRRGVEIREHIVGDFGSALRRKGVLLVDERGASVADIGAGSVAAFLSDRPKRTGLLKMAHERRSCRSNNT